jgi:hypothetical protein
MVKHSSLLWANNAMELLYKFGQRRMKKLPFSYFLVRIFSHISSSFFKMIYGREDFRLKIKKRSSVKSQG